MLTKFEIKKKILSYFLPNQLLFDDDYFDGNNHTILWISINKINKEIKDLKKRLSLYNLSEYFIVKQLPDRKIGNNYIAMFFGFSSLGMEKINEIYAICKLRDPTCLN